MQAERSNASALGNPNAPFHRPQPQRTREYSAHVTHITAKPAEEEAKRAGLSAVHQLGVQRENVAERVVHCSSLARGIGQRGGGEGLCAVDTGRGSHSSVTGVGSAEILGTPCVRIS